MKRHFDRLAKVYETLERCTFGGQLERARNHFLSELGSVSHGLLIGDGDGRFSSKLLAQYPTLTLDSIDISPAMLERSKARAGKHSNRLKTISCDANEYSYPSVNYDFIGLQFSLDCFEQQQINTLLPKLEKTLRPNGRIVYTDFRAETVGQRCIVRTLYLCFRLSTGLRVSALPTVVWSEQIQAIKEKQFLRGLIETRLLEKTSVAAPENCSEHR